MRRRYPEKPFLDRVKPKGYARLPNTGTTGFGLALYVAQLGETPPGSKPLKGFGGAGVIELIENHKGDTYRAVYTVRFSAAVYVLHVFQKKAKRGIATPMHEIELIQQRLKQAEALQIASAKERRT